MRRSLMALVLSATAFSAGAQLAPPDPDWQEVEAPPPPAFRLDRLIPLDLPLASLRFGVDPASVTLASDGIVRYVVVASSSGAVNAIYEGIRCSTAQVKVYARHNPETGWTLVPDGPWRSLHETLPSRHSLLIARTGACLGCGPNRSAVQIVRDLRAPVDTRFNN